MNKIHNIVIADDHSILAEALYKTLNSIKFNVVSIANNGEEVISIVKNQQIDLVLLDIRMPKMDGIETTVILSKEFPSIKILILSMYDRDDYVQQAIGAGAHGYILKNASLQEMGNAINSILSGGSYISPSISRNLIYQIGQNEQTPRLKLSPNERNLLDLLGQGFTTDEISLKLNISPHTINNYRKVLLKKFNVRNVSQLTLTAFRESYID